MYAPSLALMPTPGHSRFPDAHRDAIRCGHQTGTPAPLVDPGTRRPTEVEGVWVIAGTPRAAGRCWFWTDTVMACVDGIETKLGEILVTRAPDRESATSRRQDGQCLPGRDVAWIVGASLRQAQPPLATKCGFSKPGFP